MSTPSSISVKVGDTVKSIYSHWDGYPSHHGRLLLENYNSQELAEQVVSVGDLSILAESMDKPEGHSFDTSVPGCSIAYGRDRGEEGVDAKEFDSYVDALDCNEQAYNYYWDGEQWLCDDEPLTPEIVAGD